VRPANEKSDCGVAADQTGRQWISPVPAHRTGSRQHQTSRRQGGLAGWNRIRSRPLGAWVVPAGWTCERQVGWLPWTGHVSHSDAARRGMQDQTLTRHRKRCPSLLNRHRHRMAVNGPGDHAAGALAQGLVAANYTYITHAPAFQARWSECVRRRCSPGRLAVITFPPDELRNIRQGGLKNPRGAWPAAFVRWRPIVRFPWEAPSTV
jgi:hypothetical protein